MEKYVKRRKAGINGNTLRKWGIVFIVAGIIGRGVIQTHIMGMKGLMSNELLNILETMPNAMTYAAVSIALQVAETCAVPIFAMLLIEGIQKTSDINAYLKRVITLAIVSEIPFNLAFSAKFFDFGSRNPVFGVVLCMLMLIFWKNYDEKSKKNTLIKILLVVVAILWCQMLKVDHGAALVIIVSCLWAFRKNNLLFNFSGAAATMMCSLISPYYLASPMGFLAVHAYNGEESTNSHKTDYLQYPILLIIGWAFGILLQ